VYRLYTAAPFFNGFESNNNLQLMQLIKKAKCEMRLDKV